MNPIMPKYRIVTNSLFNSKSYYDKEFVIDPGDVIKDQAHSPASIVLLTHAHFDHIYGINSLIEQNPDIRIYTNEYGREMLMDAKKNLSHYYGLPWVIKDAGCIQVVEDKEIVQLANGRNVTAIFTPGHNPSCITWLIEDAIFTGDSYIPGLKIVTNLPGGNKQEAQLSLNQINDLSFGRTIYPGH